MTDLENLVHKLVQRVADLQARRAVADSVSTQLFALMLATQAEPQKLLLALRGMRVVVSGDDMSIASAANDVQIMQLKAEQFAQEYVDEIERVLNHHQ